MMMIYSSVMDRKDTKKLRQVSVVVAVVCFFVFLGGTLHLDLNLDSRSTL